jgi:hypothetical protein
MKRNSGWGDWLRRFFGKKRINEKPGKKREGGNEGRRKFKKNVL